MFRSELISTRLKVAVTVALPVTVQVVDPEHAPDQRRKAKPASGVAVSASLLLSDTSSLRAEWSDGCFSGNPATNGGTLEAFWTPVQYVRIGAQYTFYTKYNGASDNYDSLGRNARDNNSLFLYLWAAY